MTRIDYLRHLGPIRVYSSLDALRADGDPPIGTVRVVLIDSGLGAQLYIYLPDRTWQCVESDKPPSVMGELPGDRARYWPAPGDVQVDVFRGGGMAVRVTHIPTGLVEERYSERGEHSEYQMRQEALAALCRRIECCTCDDSTLDLGAEHRPDCPHGP